MKLDRPAQAVVPHFGAHISSGVEGISDLHIDTYGEPDKSRSSMLLFAYCNYVKPFLRSKTSCYPHNFNCRLSSVHILHLPSAILYVVSPVLAAFANDLYSRVHYALATGEM